MSQPSPDIAALLGSRICHDLISPIGAISNGVELLTMSGTGASPEIDLIAQSVDHANARIGFFRVAFGAASADQTMGAAETRKILADLTQGSRLDIAWQAQGDLPRPEVKLAFLLLNCIEHALPRGGRIEVTHDGAHWSLQAAAERMRIERSLWDGLSHTGAAAATSAGAAEVQFLLAPLLAAELGRTITADLSETGAALRF